MKSPDVIAGLIGIGIALIAAGFSVKYGLGKFEKPGPGFLPFIICLFLIFSNLLLITRDLSKKDKSRVKKFKLGSKWPNVIYLSIVFIIYTILWDVLGFILNTYFLMVFSLNFIGKDPLKKSVILSAIMTIVFYVVFRKYLGCDLPDGLLGLGF
jgi:putative tricarboxylic transport membrane protein